VFDFPSAASMFPGLDIDCSRWQGDLLSQTKLGSLPLNKWLLPGTHDSGATNLTTTLAPDITGSSFLNDLIKFAEMIGIPIDKIITPWATSQLNDIAGQALNGIRYFDMRLCWVDDGWHSYHFEVGGLIFDMIRDVADFLRQHKTEVAIMELQLYEPSDKGPTVEAKQQVVDFILSELRDVIYPYTGSFNMSYNQLLDANYRLMLTVDDSYMLDASRVDGRQWLWPGARSVDGQSESIYNTYANSPDFHEMWNYNQIQLKLFNQIAASEQERLMMIDDAASAVAWPPAPIQSYASPPSGCLRNGTTCMYKMSWTLTPNATAIIAGLDPNKPHSLLELAAIANAQLSLFAKMALDNNQLMGSILIADGDACVQGGSLLNVAIQQNMMMARMMEMEGERNEPHDDGFYENMNVEALITAE